MHLLLIAEETSTFINRNFHYLENELRDLVELSVWRKSGHIDRMLKSLSKRPNFILVINDLQQRIFPLIKGLAHTDIPTGLVVTDVHRLKSMRDSYIAKSRINHLFTIGRDQTIQTYPYHQHRIEWFPHFIQPEIYKDYALEKDIDLLLMGAVSKVYPLREKILNAYQNNRRFTYYSHPGYRDFHANEEEDADCGALCKNIKPFKNFLHLSVGLSLSSNEVF